MKQYHDLLQTILDKGTWKDPARENMPRTKAIFGHQMRFDLSEGFPLLTTKKVSLKNIVVELLWFLKKDSNIKFMVDNGCSIWNEDAYNYYLKKCKEFKTPPICDFDGFVKILQQSEGLNTDPDLCRAINYKFGDTGEQYPLLWRKWKGESWIEGDTSSDSGSTYINSNYIDQISEVLKSLKANPEGRRHILTAWNPSTLGNMALNACHAFVQFNCRKLTIEEQIDYANSLPIRDKRGNEILLAGFPEERYLLDLFNIPQYYLDCQMYQRSADSFLGAPYNIASYALLTEIFCKILNMIPGEFIHTFGDAHIYENHIPQVEEQLSRDINKYPLPKLKFSDRFNTHLIQHQEGDVGSLSEMIEFFEVDMFSLENYESYPGIKAKLSTGLK